MNTREISERIKHNSEDNLVGRQKQTREITAALREIEQKQKHTHQFRHKRKIERSFHNFPWCGFCGCNLDFPNNEGNQQTKRQSKDAVVHRFYRNLPKDVRPQLSGTCTSIVVCGACNDDLDRLYATKRISVLRERDGLPIAGGQ